MKLACFVINFSIVAKYLFLNCRVYRDLSFFINIVVVERCCRARFLDFSKDGKLGCRVGLWSVVIFQFSNSSFRYFCYLRGVRKVAVGVANDSPMLKSVMV